MSKVLVIILEVFQVIFTKYYIAFHYELFTIGYTNKIFLHHRKSFNNLNNTIYANWFWIQIIFTVIRFFTQ